jgi:hypothetical protein
VTVNDTRASKPALFIGSSTEGLPFARGVLEVLDDVAETTMWEHAFPPGGTFIDTLLNTVPQYDFAVLVLTPDAMVSDRDVDTLAPRDNLLFELGLFMGRLGRTRTFILHQNVQFKMPSDLAGLQTLKFNWPRADGSHVQAVGPACASIRRAIQALGFTESKTSKTVTELARKQQTNERVLSEHARQIRWMQVALQGIVTQYEFDKLVGLHRPEPFWCDYSDDLFSELKHLRAMGLARHNDGTGLSRMRDMYRGRRDRFDLKQFFHITQAGMEYLELREQIGGAGNSDE